MSIDERRREKPASLSDAGCGRTHCQHCSSFITVRRGSAISWGLSQRRARLCGHRRGHRCSRPLRAYPLTPSRVSSERLGSRRTAESGTNRLRSAGQRHLWGQGGTSERLPLLAQRWWRLSSAKPHGRTSADGDLPACMLDWNSAFLLGVVGAHRCQAKPSPWWVTGESPACLGPSPIVIASWRALPRVSPSPSAFFDKALHRCQLSFALSPALSSRS